MPYFLFLIYFEYYKFSYFFKPYKFQLITNFYQWINKANSGEKKPAFFLILPINLKKFRYGCFYSTSQLSFSGQTFVPELLFPVLVAPFPILHFPFQSPDLIAVLLRFAAYPVFLLIQTLQKPPAWFRDSDPL